MDPEFLLETISVLFASSLPLLCFCVPYLGTLAVPFAIWGGIMLVHINDPEPKPSPRERWFTVAKWFLIFWGVVGTALSIIGGVLLVIVLLPPCFLFYLILPGPKSSELIDFSRQASIPSSDSPPSARKTYQNADHDDDYDSDYSSSDNDTYNDDYDRYKWEAEQETKDDGYIPDISDGWLFKHGRYEDDDD